MAPSNDCRVRFITQNLSSRFHQSLTSSSTDSVFITIVASSSDSYSIDDELRITPGK